MAYNFLKIADDMTTLKTIRIFPFTGIIIVHVCLTYALMLLSNLFFRRQLRKHGAPLDYGALPPGTAPGAGPHPEHNGAVFGVSGGVGEGSMRGAFRQQQQQILTAKSPAGRLAVNELFGNHGIVGPPLPPANQTPAQKRQQLQKLSPQSTTSSSSHTSHSNPNPHPHQLTQPHPHQHPPHHQQRHLSAMLDENNTVRCYLEPLAK